MRSRQEAAPEVVRFLSTQVGVDSALFAQYAWEGRTIEAHRSQIRAITKVREFRRADEEALLTWLCTDILLHEHHPERLRELICAECRTKEIDVPDDLTTLIETGFASYETQIYAVVLARLTQEMQERLDALLVATPVAEGAEEEELPLSLLRLAPVRSASRVHSRRSPSCVPYVPLVCHLIYFKGMLPSWLNACDDALRLSLLPIFASIPRRFVWRSSLHRCFSAREAGH